MSQPLGWTPKPGASCGTASWVSSKRDAQSFSHHTGATSLFIYWFSLMDLHFTCQDEVKIFWLHTRESRSAKLPIKTNVNGKYCNCNWSELHFSWKVLFPVWQLILAARNTLAAIKLSWSMRAYWLTGAFFPPWKEKLSISVLESFHYPRLPGAKLVFPTFLL